LRVVLIFHKNASGTWIRAIYRLLSSFCYCLWDVLGSSFTASVANRRSQTGINSERRKRKRCGRKSEKDTYTEKTKEGSEKVLESFFSRHRSYNFSLI